MVHCAPGVPQAILIRLSARLLMPMFYPMARPYLKRRIIPRSGTPKCRMRLRGSPVRAFHAFSALCAAKPLLMPTPCHRMLPMLDHLACLLALSTRGCPLLGWHDRLIASQRESTQRRDNSYHVPSTRGKAGGGGRARERESESRVATLGRHRESVQPPGASLRCVASNCWTRPRLRLGGERKRLADFAEQTTIKAEREL